MRIPFYPLLFSALFFMLQPALSHAAEINVDVSGFVDMSYSMNQNADDAGGAEANTFSIDQVEFDFEHKVHEKATVQVDLHYASTGSGLQAEDMVEQAFININFDKVTLTFGKFNTPIGAEGGEPTEMLQYSVAQINDANYFPGDIVGTMATFSSGMLEANLYIVNSHDAANGAFADDNKEKTFGAHLAVSPMEEKLTLGFSYLTGKEGSDPTDYNLSVLDVDLTYNPIDPLTIVAQYDSATNDPSGSSTNYSGFLAKVNYAINDTWGVTFRYDILDDGDGIVSGTADETRNAFTIAALAVITEDLGLTAEYKITNSDKDTFQDKDGNAKSSKSTAAVELVYVF